MTTIEHLKRIKAKCMEKIDLCDRNDFKRGCEESGWLSTIAAIDVLTSISEVAWDGNEMHPCGMDASHSLRDIIAAWPEELL